MRSLIVYSDLESAQPRVGQDEITKIRTSTSVAQGVGAKLMLICMNTLARWKFQGAPNRRLSSMQAVWPSARQLDVE